MTNLSELSDPSELRALLEAVSSHAETVFKAHGAVPPAWFCVTDTDEIFFMPPPPTETREEELMIVSEVFKMKSVICYVFVAEAWTAIIDKSDLSTVSSIESRADREEVLLLTGESSDGQLTAKRKILRSRREAGLGPLEYMDDIIGGARTGLLSHLQPSSRVVH